MRIWWCNTHNKSVIHDSIIAALLNTQKSMQKPKSNMLMFWSEGIIRFSASLHLPEPSDFSTMRPCTFLTRKKNRFWLKNVFLNICIIASFSLLLLANSNQIISSSWLTFFRWYLKIFGTSKSLVDYKYDRRKGSSHLFSVWNLSGAWLGTTFHPQCCDLLLCKLWKHTAQLHFTHLHGTTQSRSNNKYIYK